MVSHRPCSLLTNLTVYPTKQDTFFGNIKSSLKRPLFIVDLRTDGSGSYDFGFIDKSKYSGNITHVGINNTGGFWQLASPAFKIDGERYINTGAAPAIAGKRDQTSSSDTGLPLKSIR